VTSFSERATRTATFIARLLGAVAFMVATAAAASSVPPRDFRAKANNLLNEYVREGLFSGAVVVAQDGKPIFRRVYGLADRQWGVPVTFDTEFRLGSITKQFTATAILQLEERGRLRLDDPVSKYYERAPAAWSAITIRHLLTHSSGIPSYTAIPHFIYGQPSKVDRTPDEIISLTRDQPLEFTPGSDMVYSNTGYVLLGLIIEKITGQKYGDYLREQIFKPLGLDHTGYDDGSTIIRHMASGYHLSGDAVVKASYMSMTLPFSAGALYSSIDDMLKWDRALHAAKPIGPAAVASMFTDYGHNYGFGYYILKSKTGHIMWDHEGGIFGFHSEIAHYPNDGLTVIVLSNLEDAPAYKIGNDLADLYFGAPAPRRVRIDPAVLSNYLGYFQTGAASAAEIVRDGDHLAVNLGRNARPIPLFPEDQSTFSSPTAGIEVVFDHKGGGSSQTMILKRSGDHQAKRITDVEAHRLWAIAARPHVAIALDPRSLTALTGVYRVSPSFLLTVSEVDEHLMVRPSGAPRYPVDPETSTLFFNDERGVGLSFKLDGSGRALEATFIQGGIERPAPRIS
jgi:CubicO group peptidase (beta-lactamase class C family)